MTGAQTLFHKWLKQWGTCFGDHEREVVKDIEDYNAAITEFAHREAIQEATVWNRAIDAAAKLIVDSHTKGRCGISCRDLSCRIITLKRS